MFKSSIAICNQNAGPPVDGQIVVQLANGFLSIAVPEFSLLARSDGTFLHTLYNARWGYQALAADALTETVFAVSPEIAWHHCVRVGEYEVVPGEFCTPAYTRLNFPAYSDRGILFRQTAPRIELFKYLLSVRIKLGQQALLSVAENLGGGVPSECVQEGHREAHCRGLMPRR